jgi:hypothetical protein
LHLDLSPVPCRHVQNSYAPLDWASFPVENLEVHFSLASDATGTTRKYSHLHEVVKDVEHARVLVGFHFRNSDLEGSILGRNVAFFIIDRFSQRDSVRSPLARFPLPAKVLRRELANAGTY